MNFIEKKRAINKFAFYIHTATYLVVNIALAIVNLIVDPQNIWFFWPLLGWGAGLGLHGAIVFLSNDSNKFFQKMIQWEIEKEQNLSASERQDAH